MKRIITFISFVLCSVCAFCYTERNLLEKQATLEQLNIVLSGMKQKANQASTGMQKAEKRMKDIAGIQSAIAVYQEQKAVHDKYLKIGWKKDRLPLPRVIRRS